MYKRLLTSGYRSREAQQAIWDERQDDTVNRPGESEHESGLAFDVTAMNSQGGFETTEQFAWLEENCWDYGFIPRYPEDKEDVTGITYEPWHYRYVGVEAAQAMRASGETLEEYLDQTKYRRRCAIGRMIEGMTFWDWLLGLLGLGLLVLELIVWSSSNFHVGHLLTVCLLYTSDAADD